MMLTSFNRKGKTCAFLTVLLGLICSMIKDDNLKENTNDDGFQSEGKNPTIFDGFEITLKLDDFIARWPFSIGK